MAEHPAPTTDELQLQIRGLQRSVAALTKERDDLAKDVEQLCLTRYAAARPPLPGAGPGARLLLLALQGRAHVLQQLRGI